MLPKNLIRYLLSALMLVFCLLFSANASGTTAAKAFTQTVLPLPGDLDPTFGTGGEPIIVDFASHDNYAGGLVVLANDRILVSGWAAYTGDTYVRSHADGSFDTSFGSNGKVTTSFSGSNCGHVAALQPAGKIVVDVCYNTGGDFRLVRYNSDSSLDSTFGDSGKVITAFGGEKAYAIALRPDGKIILAGTGFALAQYNENGSLDTVLSDDGKAIGYFGSDVSPIAHSVMVQSDGKIVSYQTLTTYSDIPGLLGEK
jgi:uncharacterized delta-60 repeat protein